MTDDTLLLEALSRGDRAALEQLYDRHAGVLYAFALHLVEDRTRAEDLLHDTFVDLNRLARQLRAQAERPPVLRWLVLRLFARARTA